MNTHKHQKRDSESLQEWIDRISVPDSRWFIKAKRRQKYKMYYDAKFYIQLKYIMFKKMKIRNIIKAYWELLISGHKPID